MSNCPGYVNVKVDVWPTSPAYKPLANYDVLVSCPPTFSLSFSLPRRDADVARSTTDDCILEGVFDDGKHARRLLMRPRFDRRRSSDPQRRPAAANDTTERSYDVDAGNLDVDLPTFGVAVLLTTSITLTVVSLFCELFRLTKVRRRVRRALRAGGGRLPANCEGSAAAARLSSSTSSPPPPASVQPRRKSSVAARRTCVSACVVVARLVYAFAFTFSVFVTLVGVALRQQVGYAVATTSSTPESRPIAADFDEDSVAATGRRQMTRCLAGTAVRPTGTGRASSRRFAAVADVVASSVGAARTAAARWARRAAERLVADVEVALTRRRRYARAASLNRWLLFPRALYNQTTERDNRTSSPIDDANLTTTNTFWNFLHVTPLEADLTLWTTTIRDR